MELSDASAERSVGGCTVHLNKEPIIEYINSNITMLQWMIATGYSDVRTINRRIKAMEAWLADPQLIKGDADAEYAAVIVSEEGHYGVLGSAGARMEMPGCSLCMGNQAQVKEGAVVFSTSTRNFPNRLRKNSNVYLGSAELAAICAKLGRIPTRAEYMADMGVLTAASDKVYQYLNFDKVQDYMDAAASVKESATV